LGSTDLSLCNAARRQGIARIANATV
jgi:hypothetical protein